jgi:hypothetical protein
MSATPFFAGEHLCHSLVLSTSTPCQKKAYFRVGANVFCGTHSRKDSHIRRALPKAYKPPFDLDAQMRDALWMRGGAVGLQRMGMMKSVAQLPYWVCVFPNYRHANRKDGIGMATLSPMRLGPVVHGQPGFSNALNLEQFHQFSKRYTNESEEEFRLAKERGFLDPVPHRRKQHGKPLYWSWVSASGVEHKLDYVTCRQFYCHFYELLVREQDEWTRLYNLVHVSKVNTQICGYDAFPIEPTKEAIYDAYKDESRPFGHERVLFTMLVLADPFEYPWNAMWIELL